MKIRDSRWWVVATLVLVGLVVPLPAFAQQEAAQETEATPKTWSNEAQLSLVDSAGNASSRTFAVSDRFAYNWTYSELILTADIFRQSSDTRVLTNEIGGVREDTIERVDAARYEAGAKFRQNLLDELFWYALGSWYQNEPSGVESRWSTNGGFGYRFLENDRSLVAGEIGAGLVREDLVGASADSFVDGRAYVEVRHQFSDHAGFKTEAELLENLQDTGDLRLNLKASVTSEITDILALRIGWDLKFDNQPTVVAVDSNPDAPPAPFVFDKTDRTLSASIVVSF